MPRQDLHARFARVGHALREALFTMGARRWLSQSLWLSAKETEPTALPPIPPDLALSQNVRRSRLSQMVPFCADPDSYDVSRKAFSLFARDADE